MGIFDIFTSRPSKKAILSQVRKAKEVYAQPEYRRMAMEKLLKWDTTESLSGLLERFCVVVQSPHWDEDEKRWLVDELVKRGDTALPILREFVMKKNDINYALLAYQKIVSDQKLYKELVVDALKARAPSDHRSIQAKQELIAALREMNEISPELLLPYLDDHSDDVQCAAIDALAKNQQQEVKTKLVKLLQSEIHSARVLRAAAHVVEQNKIAIGDNVKLSDAVQEDFMIEAGHLVRSRQKTSK